MQNTRNTGGGTAMGVCEHLDLLSQVFLIFSKRLKVTGIS